MMYITSNITNNKRYFKTIRPNTKKANDLIYRYQWALKREPKSLSVLNWYKSPSYNKVRAEMQIQEFMQEYDGWDYRVMGGNDFLFCAGWLTIGIDEKTGEANTYLMYETYSTTYVTLYK